MKPTPGTKYVYTGEDGRTFCGSYVVTHDGAINTYDCDGQQLGIADTEAHARRIVRAEYDRTHNLIRTTRGAVPEMAS